ncbi:uncharacterized protein DFL_003046 [Arthrobotrys flagrans]|uniref:Uncharacterized protein n=1 Tax=Arthrobotrys flagrans TaxID=97331 RepID=A0A437ACL1_ARTFL|nr:hypothetical protein DFL_003046 [Arthrobotrys flagrans]
MPWPSLPQNSLHGKVEEALASSIPSHPEDSNHHLYDANRSIENRPVNQQDGLDHSPVRGPDAELGQIRRPGRTIKRFSKIILRTPIPPYKRRPSSSD